jgi:hypothetical protein
MFSKQTAARCTSTALSWGGAHIGCLLTPMLVSVLPLAKQPIFAVGTSTIIALGIDFGIQKLAPTWCRCRRDSWKRRITHIALPAMAISWGVHTFAHDGHDHEQHVEQPIPNERYTDERGKTFLIMTSQICGADGQVRLHRDTIPAIFPQ